MQLPWGDYQRVLSTMPILCVDCLVINDNGEFLLVKRNNEPLKGAFWVPGGRVLKGERLDDAVHRKMREEIGVAVSIIRQVGFFEDFFDAAPEGVRGGVHSVSFVYLVRPKSNAIRIDDQSAGWGWFKDLPTRLRRHACVAAVVNDPIAQASEARLMTQCGAG